jgi:hypothetical protein
MSLKVWTINSLMCLAIFISGCDGSLPAETETPEMPPPTSAPPVSTPGVSSPATQTQADPTEQTQVDAPDLMQPVIQERIRKRLNIDQLGQAISAASRGIRWSQGNDDDLLSTLAFTLGKPDYFEVTNEDLGSTVLFMKFLEDAAGSVCRQMTERDLETGSHDLIAASDETVPQIVSLVLRFHHRNLAEDHPDIKQWIWLYETALRISESDTEAWRTVCVALIRHPDFYTY